MVPSQNISFIPKNPSDDKKSTALPSPENQIQEVANNALQKYPPDYTKTKLNSTLEIKQTWLYYEWDERCQFSNYIKPNFPNRNVLNPTNKPNKIEQISLIKSTFHEVRGKYTLWKDAKETGRWKKIVVPALSINWVKDNIKILYSSENRFTVSDLHGLVLWKDSKAEEKYQLLEGNHRVSAWLASEKQEPLPATIFIGKPKK